MVTLKKKKDELTFSMSPFLKLSSSSAVALKSYFPRASIRTDSAVFRTCSSKPKKVQVMGEGPPKVLSTHARIEKEHGFQQEAGCRQEVIRPLREETLISMSVAQVQLERP